MILKKGMQLCRKQATTVYTAGEHGTAFMYAVCEFTDLHLMLIGASVVLLIGIILIVLDKVLDLVGMVE